MLVVKCSLQAVILVSCYSRFKYSSVSYAQVHGKRFQRSTASLPMSASTSGFHYCYHQDFRDKSSESLFLQRKYDIGHVIWAKMKIDSSLGYVHYRLFVSWHFYYFLWLKNQNKIPIWRLTPGVYTNAKPLYLLTDIDCLSNGVLK